MDDRFVGMKSNFRGALRKFFRPRLPAVEVPLEPSSMRLRESRFLECS